MLVLFGVLNTILAAVNVYFAADGHHPFNLAVAVLCGLVAISNFIAAGA